MADGANTEATPEPVNTDKPLTLNERIAKVKQAKAAGLPVPSFKPTPKPTQTPPPAASETGEHPATTLVRNMLERPTKGGTVYDQAESDR